MALILCNECGEQVSDKAENCPHCGAPVVAKGKEYSEIETCKVCGKYFGRGKTCVSCGAERNDIYVLRCEFALGHLARMYEFFHWLTFKKMEKCNNESKEDVAVFDKCLVKILTIMSLHSYTKKYKEFFKKNDCRENHEYILDDDTYEQIINQEVNILQIIENFDITLDEVVFGHSEEWCSGIVHPSKCDNKEKYYARRYAIYRTFWRGTAKLCWWRQRFLYAFHNKDYKIVEESREMIFSELGIILCRMYNAVNIMGHCLDEVETKYNMV